MCHTSPSPAGYKWSCCQCLQENSQLGTSSCCSLAQVGRGWSRERQQCLIPVPAQGFGVPPEGFGVLRAAAGGHCQLLGSPMERDAAGHQVPQNCFVSFPRGFSSLFPFCGHCQLLGFPMERTQGAVAVPAGHEGSHQCPRIVLFLFSEGLAHFSHFVGSGCICAAKIGFYHHSQVVLAPGCCWGL